MAKTITSPTRQDEAFPLASILPTEEQVTGIADNNIRPCEICGRWFPYSMLKSVQSGDTTVLVCPESLQGIYIDATNQGWVPPE